MRAMRRPPHSGRVRQRTPQRPGRHIEYQPYGHTQWQQSTLPIGMGGLGIRRASSLALSAFLASAAGTLALQSEILSQLEDDRDQHVEALEAEWRSEADMTQQTASRPTYGPSGTNR